MSCIFQGVFEDVFKTYPFNNTASIRFWHLHAARFGHPNDILLLIDGTKSQGQDYLRGLLASSILIFSIAVVWCILLLVSKWLGPRRVGFLSGRHVPLPPNPGKEEAANGDDNKIQEGPTAWEHKYNKVIRARTIMKVLVVVAGLGVIINAILLSVRGAKDLLHTLDGVDYVISYATQLMEEGVSLINNVLYTESQLENQTQAALDAINGICPEVLQPICTNITDVQTCNFEVILNNYTDIANFVALLAATKADMYKQLNRSKYDLLDSIAFANSISDISQTFNWAFWCSVGFSSATALASVFYVYRAIRPPTKSSRCSCRNVFVTPCFVLLVFLSWIFAMVFVIGSIGLADTCYDSPDDNFKALLQRIQNSFSPLVYKSIIFYVSGCPIGQAVHEVVHFLEYLTFFFQTASTAMQSLDLQNISATCGAQSVFQAHNATSYVSTSICEMAGLMRDVHMYLQCANWYPLYDEGVYQAMCDQGTSGFAWVTSTQIAIVICSMVILSLRVVFHEIDFEDPIPTDNKVENNEQYTNGVEALPDLDTKADEEQAVATLLVVDQKDDVPGKDEAQVLESTANISDDDPKEVLTVPLEDSDTNEGDNGDVAVLSQVAENNQDPRAFAEEEGVLAADENGVINTEPLEASEAETDKDVLVESVLLSEGVTEITRSVVEDEKMQQVNESDVVLVTEAPQIKDAVVTDENMIKDPVNEEETPEETKDLPAEVDNELVVGGVLEPEVGSVESPPVGEPDKALYAQVAVATSIADAAATTTNDVDVDGDGGNEALKDSPFSTKQDGREGPISTVEKANVQDVNQDVVVLIHDSKQTGREAVPDENVVETDNNDGVKTVETGKKGIDNKDTAKPVKEPKGVKESDGVKKPNPSATESQDPETSHQSSIVEDIQEQEVDQVDPALLLGTAAIDQEAITETEPQAEEEPDDAAEPELAGDANSGGVDESTPLIKNENDERIDEDNQTPEANQSDILLNPDATELNEQVVADENVVTRDDEEANGEVDETIKVSGEDVDVAVESLSAPAENTHG